MSSLVEVLRALLALMLLVGCGAHRAPPARPAPPADRPTTLAAGIDHACAWMHGALHCWGRNDAGQVAPWPSGVGPRGAPVTSMSAWAVDAPRAVRDLALGYGHSCVLTADARVRCFGGLGGSAILRASVGLDADDRVASDVLHDVTLRGTPSSIDADGAATCATTEEGPVYCWGLITQLRCDSDLGSASVLNALCGVRAKPVELPLLAGSVGVSVSHTRICGWTARGQLTCIEHDRERENRTRARIVLPSGVDEACSARSRDEEVLCVRRGAAVQCGVDSDAPGAALSDVTGIACGEGVCAVKADGSVWCSDGLRGFSRVPLVADAIAVAVGDGFMCAQREGGGVACWGEGTIGQLGWSSRVRRAPVLDGGRLYGEGERLCGVRHVGRGYTATRCVGPGGELLPAVDSNDASRLAARRVRCVVQIDRDEVWCQARDRVTRLAFPEGEDPFEIRVYVEGGRACALWPRVVERPQPRASPSLSLPSAERLSPQITRRSARAAPRGQP